MKVYMSGGPLNGTIQDVSADHTSWLHYRLHGRSQDNYREAIKRLGEGDPSGTAMITLHAEDVVKTIYLPVGEEGYIPNAVIEGVSYPIWKTQA